MVNSEIMWILYLVNFLSEAKFKLTSMWTVKIYKNLKMWRYKANDAVWNGSHKK